MHYSSLFQCFFLDVLWPLLKLKIPFFVYLFVNFLWLVNPHIPHLKKEMASSAPALSIIIWKVKYPLRFIVSYVQHITQHYESKTMPKAPHEFTHTASKERSGTACPSRINCHLKSEVSIKLHYSTNKELFEKHLCNQSSHVHYGKYGWFPLWREAITCWHFSLLAKMNGTQSRTLVNPWRIHCTVVHQKAPLGPLNSEKIKPVALVDIELRLSEGISQSVNYSVSC